MSSKTKVIEKSNVEYMYARKEMSQQAIADHYGVSPKTIGRRMEEYGIKARPKSIPGHGRQYHINVHFFKKWTPDSAWLYGWAIGDGCFTNPLCLSFNLGRPDREVLEKFKIAIPSEHKIDDYRVWSKEYKKFRYHSRLIFHSKTLVTDIKKFSYTDVPKEYFNHFLRGFFEAEGCVYWGKRRSPKVGSIKSDFTQNDSKIMKFIYYWLKDLGIVEGGSLHPHGEGWKLIFSVNDSLSLYHYMYDNCGKMFLKRKKEKFEYLMQRQLGGKKK